MNRSSDRKDAPSRWSLPIAGLFALGLPGPVAALEQTFDCVIDPSQIIKLSSPVIGQLAEVAVERGDKVTKGQIIARLESAVEVRTVALRQAQAQATAQIDVQRERFALARKTHDRATRMASSAAITEQEIDELKSTVRVNQLELTRVQQDQDIARLELERAQAVLEQRTIRSPVDAVVTQRVLSPGEYVDNDTYIVELADLDPLYVEAFLPVVLYPEVVEGMAAVVEPQAPFSGRFAADVLTVDRVFDTASGTFGVRLGLANRDEQLPAGLRCRVTFSFDG